MSISKKDKSECCGCNACAEICPKHCIEMKLDKYGFLYPSVDESVCIECGACERVCPFPAAETDLKRPINAYAAWVKDDDDHRRSASGGAAYAISRNILEAGGVVYGCAAEGIDVRHIRVDSLNDLPLLQGSKYVQSDVRGLFSKVRKDLKDGRKVVFIGTPCQVAGLRKFIRVLPDNLLLVDLICHGTPSQQMLREHIAHVVPGKKIDKMTFRKGNDFKFILSENGSVVWTADLWNEPMKDMYYRGFIQGVTYRKSCNICSFGRAERVSDITIGDFWGLKAKDLFPNPENMGTSVVMPITEKGARMVESIRKTMSMVERPLQEAIDGNDQLRHPVPLRRSAKLFFKLYPLIPFDYAVWLSLDGAFRRLVKKILRPLKPVLKPIINVVRR